MSNKFDIHTQAFNAQDVLPFAEKILKRQCHVGIDMAKGKDETVVVKRAGGKLAEMLESGKAPAVYIK